MYLLKSICQKWILKQLQHQERIDDCITKVWSKIGSFSYHYIHLWDAVKLPSNTQINLELEILHILLHNAVYYSLERIISAETGNKRWGEKVVFAVRNLSSAGTREDSTCFYYPAWVLQVTLFSRTRIQSLYLHRLKGDSCLSRVFHTGCRAISIPALKHLLLFLLHSW